jgi:hypothetical protein
MKILNIFKAFLIAMGISATIHITYTMFAISFLGIDKMCFYEHHLWISIPEMIFGIMSIILLSYYCISLVKGENIK